MSDLNAHSPSRHSPNFEEFLHPSFLLDHSDFPPMPSEPAVMTTDDKTATNNLLDDDDLSELSELPEEEVEMPKKKSAAAKRRASAPVDTNVDNTGVPGQIQFPAGLPTNIVNLLRQYFLANNSNIVPRDIYYLQVPWVFKNHDAKLKKDATDAGYVSISQIIAHCLILTQPQFHAITNEQVEIRAFSLPWMNTQPGGTNSQRLLVAMNDPLPDPVVLCRAKRNSSEYRIWRGINDDPLEQAIIVKRPLIHPDNKLSVAINNNVFASANALPIATSSTTRNLRKRPRSPTTISKESESDKPIIFDAATFPAALTATATTESEVAKHVIFRFRGPNYRTRTLAACNSFVLLFTNATAAGIIVPVERYPVLKCVMNGRRVRIVADEQDWQEMVADVVKDEVWKGKGEEEAFVIEVGK